MRQGTSNDVTKFVFRLWSTAAHATCPMFGNNFLIKPNEDFKKKIIDSEHIQAQFPGNQSRRKGRDTVNSQMQFRSNSLYKSLCVYLELKGYGTG